MKSKDILTALGDVSERYKTEAEEGKADKIFKKSEKKGAGLRVFKFVLSGAALLGLCAFAIFIGVAKNRDNIAASMLERGADIPHAFSKTELEKTSYTPDGKTDGSEKFTVSVCDITPSGVNDVDTQTKDYLMFGGMCILDVDSTTGNSEKTEDGQVTYALNIEATAALKTEHKKLGDGMFFFVFNRYGFVTEKTELSTIAVMFNGDGTERWRITHKNPVGTAPENFLQAYLDDGKIYVVTAMIEDIFTKADESSDGFTSYAADDMCRELVITVYDEQTGEILSRKSAKTALKTTTFGTHCIGKTEYGFVITVLTENWSDDPYIILLGYDGNIISVCRYGMEYEFCSAASINGEIYLSGKSMPQGKNMSPFTHSCIISYPDIMFRHEFLSIKTVNDYAFKRYKEETKAFLMVCDANLTPTKAYTQSGSFGGIISTENNSLYWDACEITAAYGSNSNGDVNKSDYTYATLIGSAKTYVINEKGALEALTGSDNKYVMVGYRMD